MCTYAMEVRLDGEYSANILDMFICDPVFNKRTMNVYLYVHILCIILILRNLWFILEKNVIENLSKIFLFINSNYIFEFRVW